MTSPTQEHQCSDDPGEKMKIVQQIKELMKELEDTPCIPRPPVPPNLKFLERKQPRFIEDPDSVPTITHLPLLELRPTSDYKKLTKNMAQLQNVVYVEVPATHNVHASPPWALPGGTNSPTVMRQIEPLPCPKKECVCCSQAVNKFGSQPPE